MPALALLVAASTAPLRPAGAANEPYFIGAVVSESGPGSSLGRPEADSIQMAVDEINKAGGVNGGHQLQVQIIDDQSQRRRRRSTRCASCSTSIPIAIIGSSLTQTSLAMVPLTQPASIPLISMASSAQVIEPVSERKWVFKMPITDTHVATALQAYMKKQKQTKLAVIYRDDDYGKTGLQHFKDAPDGKSFELRRRRRRCDRRDRERRDDAAHAHAKAANPQAIVAWTTLPSANVIIKGYRELEPAVPDLLLRRRGDRRSSSQQAGAALNGAYIASTKINVADPLPNSDPQKKILVHYIGDFLKAIRRTARSASSAASATTASTSLKDGDRAREERSTARRCATRSSTRRTPASPGRSASRPRDHNGLSGDSLVITQVENGKFTIAK